MSVLETFYILFKSDADKAAVDLKKVDAAGNKVEKSLTGADRAASRLSASFLGMAKAIAGPLLALASVNSVFEIVTGRAAEIRELDQFSAKLNSTIGDVDAFKRAVQGMGGDGARALDSLVKIGEKFNEAFSDENSGARKDFTEWGLSFKDAQGNALGATDAMLALAGSIENVSRAEALARIKKLGVEDPASIELILKGRKAVEGYIQTQKDLGVVTEAQAETTRKYYSALGELGNKLGSVGNKIAETLLPAFTSTLELLSRLVDWVGKNQHLVEGFFIGVALAVTTWLVPAMWSLAAGVLAATWPLLLIVAAIAAFGVAMALAYDDFKAWADGQPSVLGDLLGDYKTFMASLQGLFDAFSWDGFLQDLANLKQILADAFSLEGAMQDIENVKAAFVSLGQTITDAVGGAIRGVISLITGIPDAVKAAAIAIPATLAAGTTSGVVQPDAPYTGGMNPAAAADYIRNGQWALGNAGNAPQSMAAPTVNRTTTVTVGSVTVETQATDAAGIAAAVSGALKQELQNTSSGLDDGVDR